MNIEPRAPGAVPGDEHREREAPSDERRAGVEEQVHALLEAQAADDAHDGPREAAREGGVAVALRRVAGRREGQRRVVDDANPAAAMSERSSLSVRHDHDAVSRTEQSPIDPVVESRLAGFGREAMEEPYPAPRDAQPAQQIRHRRRLVPVGLHYGRSPAAQ